MDADFSNNENAEGHAINPVPTSRQQQHHHDESSDETFFDYSDVEEGSDDEDDLGDDQENRSDGNDQIEHNLLGEIGNSRQYRLSQDFETTALDRHIQRMDWPAVLRRIKIYPQECCTVDITNGQTPLHVACHAGAPAVIIQSLCQVYPEASIRTDRCNMNPLHITCSSNSASLNTVHALLNHGSSEQISMRDVDGDTPLHAACRCGANKEVIDFLLQAYPGAVHVHDFEGFTPLVRLWVRYYVILGENEIYNAIECPSKLDNDVRFLTAWDQTLLLLRYAYHGSGTVATASGSSTTKPTSIYAASVSFRQQICSTQRLHSPPKNLTAMNSLSPFESPVDQELPFVLHAVSAVDCPRFVVQLAIRKYRTQLFQRDEYGRSPLMVACAAPIYSCHNLSDDMSWTHDNIDDEGNIEQDEESRAQRQGIPLELDQNYRTLEATEENDLLPHALESKLSVIELILQASINLVEVIELSPEQQHMMKYSGADWVDPSGRLPLHIAIDSGKMWSDGLDALIKRYPESISMTDRLTKLYPYQLAATKATQNDSTINDCYKLLRLNPTVLSMSSYGSNARRADSPLSPLNTVPSVEEITTEIDTDVFIPATSDIFTSTCSTSNESTQRKRRKF